MLSDEQNLKPTLCSCSPNERLAFLFARQMSKLFFVLTRINNGYGGEGHSDMLQQVAWTVTRTIGLNFFNWIKLI